MRTVTQIGLVHVKATRFLQVQEARAEAHGLSGDRKFMLLEADGTPVPLIEHSRFIPLRFLYDEAAESLTLDLPDGECIKGSAIATGALATTPFHGSMSLRTRAVSGGWERALSDFAGRRVTLVRCEAERPGVDILPLTFLTSASLKRLEHELGAPVDPARFRAALILENDDAEEEDGWAGRLMRIGRALMRIRTAVPRCMITQLNPVTGVRDLEVVSALSRFRARVGIPDDLLPGYASVGFATYAEVVEPGVIRVGDCYSLQD